MFNESGARTQKAWRVFHTKTFVAIIMQCLHICRISILSAQNFAWQVYMKLENQFRICLFLWCGIYLWISWTWFQIANAIWTIIINNWGLSPDNYRNTIHSMHSHLFDISSYLIYAIKHLIFASIINSDQISDITNRNCMDSGKISNT